MKNVTSSMFLQLEYQLLRLRYPITNVLDRRKTSELLASNTNLSVVRYGDGELGQILNKDNIGFQSYDYVLSRRLREILTSEYDPNILVCIPDLFMTAKHLKKKPQDYWIRWIIRNRAALYDILPSYTMGDSLVSRLYLPWVDSSQDMDIVKNLKKTWKNKSVTIVEGDKTRWGVGNDLLDDAQSVRRILCPSENAYSYYDEIFDSCIKYAAETDIFILALGPTATVLGFDLAKNGKRALDLGHFDLQYEYLRNQSVERAKISGKYNNEIADTDVTECLNKEYLTAIVEKIGL